MTKSQRLCCIGIILGLLTLEPAMGETPTGHTDWCFGPTTNNRIVDQPMDQGNCGAYLTAGAVLSIFSGNQAVANLIMNSRQNQWAAEAAKLACSPVPSPQDLAMAVGLIAACQCHNMEAQDAVRDNTKEVIATLRRHGGCSSTGGQSPPNDNRAPTFCPGLDKCPPGSGAGEVWVGPPIVLPPKPPPPTQAEIFEAYLKNNPDLLVFGTDANARIARSRLRRLHEQMRVGASALEVQKMMRVRPISWEMYRAESVQILKEGGWIMCSGALNDYCEVKYPTK